ncbi:hypothetical protein MBLNU230_g5037t1 [Neophaeotheca triangularis]
MQRILFPIPSDNPNYPTTQEPNPNNPTPPPTKTTRHNPRTPQPNPDTPDPKPEDQATPQPQKTQRTPSLSSASTTLSSRSTDSKPFKAPSPHSHTSGSSFPNPMKKSFWRRKSSCDSREPAAMSCGSRQRGGGDAVATRTLAEYAAVK